MPLFVVAILPVLVGLGLIAAIGRFASPPRPPAIAAGDDARPEIPAAELGRIVGDLGRALGLEQTVCAPGASGALELAFRDRRPLVGGSVVLHVAAASAGPVDAPAVRAFAEALRGEGGVSKGIVVASQGFTSEARFTVDSLPATVQLLDGADIETLVAEHLPAAAAAALRGYRGFGPARA